MKYLILIFLFITGCITDDEIKKETTISPGTYELTYMDADGNFLLSQLDLNSDGTYFVSIYLTSESLGISQQLIGEFKGSYSISGKEITYTNQLERFFDWTDGNYSPWELPDGGSTDNSRIRNITPTTFQEYLDDNGEWMTWTKVEVINEIT